MPSATDFLPLCITMLMKREIIWLPCFGSGSSSRVGVLPFLDISVAHLCLRTLRAVLGTALATLGDAGRIERAAHGVVTHTREILDTAAADEHDAVFLQIVAFAADVADDFEAVGQAHLGDLAKRRVRLLRGGRVDARADAAALRAVFQCGRRALVGLRRTRL